METVIKGVGQDAPTVVNEKGGKQSHVPYRFDLIDAQAMLALTEIAAEEAAAGADPYHTHWRDHVDEFLYRVYLQLAGDETEDHLAYAMYHSGMALSIWMGCLPVAEYESKSLSRFGVIGAKAVFDLAEILATGATKYGEENWRQIPWRDNLNHAITHAFAHLAGDDQDDHMGHAFCRAMFAHATYWAELDRRERKQAIRKAAF